MAEHGMATRLLMRLAVGAAVAIAFAKAVATPPPLIVPLDPVPARFQSARLVRNGPHVVLHLAGSPEQMGRQHGTLLRKTIRAMVEEYIGPALLGEQGRRLRTAARGMWDSLPADYLAELDACAAAAGVDAEDLLLAQCEGDLRSAIIGTPLVEQQACSSYVAFGPATADGTLQCGRNLDYYFGNSVPRRASLVTYYSPAKGDGYRFASVGLAGILGGWTFVNEHGLVVANHVGGGMATRLDGIPTLILARLVAQHARTVQEGVDLIRNSPRMRGQIIWLAQDADPATGRSPRAVAVEYDAERAALRESEDGVLVVTNQNRAFSPLPPPHLICGRYLAMESFLGARRGRLNLSDTPTLIPGVLGASTLHTVQVHPATREFLVRFVIDGNIQEKPVRYRMP
jgi:hypothetical protein